MSNKNSKWFKTWTFVGTPLPPLEEDTVPSKKPVYVEDQIVTDENGKRRFHGAFTGGFSAGYWNTVGSKEGWTPQEFKSSRGDRAQQRQQQRPENFMDEEDLGEFGIAPQRVVPREEFALETEENRKRKLNAPLHSGAIPGEAILYTIAKPVKENAAVKILKSWGWRPGQGIGPRQTRKEKKEARKRNERLNYVMQHYTDGTQEGAPKMNSIKSDEDESSESDDDEMTFAPDDFDYSWLKNPKDNYWGLGYKGLSREPVLSTFTTTTKNKGLELLNKNNKKITISGQAFGVGAFEEDDADIYERDDMTRYDFSLDNKQKKKKATIGEISSMTDFVQDEKPYIPPVFTVELPPGWKPRNWLERKSRFEPIDPRKAKQLERKFKNFNLTPDQRADLLGEQKTANAIEVDPKDENTPCTSTQSQIRQERQQDAKKRQEDKAKELLEMISAKSNNFTRGGLITSDGQEETTSNENITMQEDHQVLQAKAANKTKQLHSSTLPDATFKPFLGNDAKQQRYEQFLAANPRTEEEISTFLSTIQPVHLSEWHREMEKKEFKQARSIYKPLEGIMSDRFVTEAVVKAEKAIVETKKEQGEQIKMERTKSMWKPNSLLCKRFNIPEPFGGTMESTDKKRGKQKLSIFNYLETSVNTKADFQTPVIIPKHIEKPKAIIRTAIPLNVKEPDAKTTATEENPPAPVQQKEKEIVISEPASSSMPIKLLNAKSSYSELEQLIDSVKDKPLTERTDIYKLIFDSSDDDEKEDKEKEKDKEQEHNDKIDNITKIKTAAETNLLRNTSPPRGLFAALFTVPVAEKKADESTCTTSGTAVIKDAVVSTALPTKITFKSRSERLKAENEQKKDEVTTMEPPLNIYGPQIPVQLKSQIDANGTTTTTTKTTAATESNVDNKLLELLKMQKSLHVIEDEWVEKVLLSSESDDTTSSSSSSGDSNKRKKSAKKLKKKKSHERKIKKMKKDKKKSKKYAGSSHKSKSKKSKSKKR